MRKRKISFNEAEITELLASTGFIFPRNKTELERFETLFGDADFGLTGREIDPDVILNKKKEEPRIVKLSEVNNLLEDGQRLVARKEEDSHKLNIDEIIDKSNNKKNQNKE